MPFNPGILQTLEAAGMSNAALEQLARLVEMRENGSVTWHLQTGRFLKFAINLTGSMRDQRAMQRTTASLDEYRL